MSQKFIVMKSTNSTEPHILGVKNTHEEAYALMTKDFIDYVENNNPQSYFKHDNGAQASDYAGKYSAYWTIESIQVDNSAENPKNSLPDKIIAVIRNYKGLCEKNYLFTEDDFRTFVDDAETKDNLNKKINSMKEGNTEEFAFWGNDTFSAWIIKKDVSSIHSFLSGEFNDDATRMLIDNYDSSKSPLENIIFYGDWYYSFEMEESSKEIVDIIINDPLIRYCIHRKGGSIERPYVDALREILETFKSEPKIYKEIESTINLYDALS